jgi:hypothetical protein
MIAEALYSLKPNAKWILKDNEIQWLDTEQTQPTQSEIDAEVARLQAKYEANNYQRQRAAEYPSIAEQLDTLYHGGLTEWKATIKAVKDKYPKE